MPQALIPFEDIHVKEFVGTDENGNEQSEVHLVITLQGIEGESLDLIVRFHGPNMLGSFVEVLEFYRNRVFPDAEPLVLNLTEDQFKLRHLSVSDERKV